jgi:hypothetical protein
MAATHAEARFDGYLRDRRSVDEVLIMGIGNLTPGNGERWRFSIRARFDRDGSLYR